MVDHEVGENRVEAAIGKRQVGERRLLDPRLGRCPLSDPKHPGVWVYGRHLGPGVRGKSGQRVSPSADVKNPAETADAA